jgi:flavin reductase (DIM6/NTAB) family NADH-FMN oxidoreductase RutF
MMKALTPDEAFARSAPMIYTVVTCLDELGNPNALGVSWVARTSWNPFLMLISIDLTRYSHAGIRQNMGICYQLPGGRTGKGCTRMRHVVRT